MLPFLFFTIAYAYFNAMTQWKVVWLGRKYISEK